jgi:flagellar protein FlaG
MRVDQAISPGGRMTAETAVTSVHPAPDRGSAETTRSDTARFSEEGRDLLNLEKTIESLRKFEGWGNFTIDFARDDQTGSLVISIVDRETGEVLRQIPPDQILSLRSHLQKLLQEVFGETVEHQG